METLAQTVTDGEPMAGFGRLRHAVTDARRATRTARLSLRLTHPPTVCSAVRAGPGVEVSRPRQSSLVARAPHRDPEGGRMRG